ncbi:hypothetical protein BJ912DRAFT_1001134 [Pholiota molesta]|nr:hypothetical protein BJ912DRAFT_1001134 [Pholiota molesta]
MASAMLSAVVALSAVVVRPPVGCHAGVRGWVGNGRGGAVAVGGHGRWAVGMAHVDAVVSRILLDLPFPGLPFALQAHSFVSCHSPLSAVVVVDVSSAI